MVRQNEIFGRIVPQAAPATTIAASASAVAQTKAEAAGTNAPPWATAPFHFRTQRIEDPDRVRDLQASGAEYQGERPSFLTQFLLSGLLPLAIYVGLWSLLSRKLGVSGQSVFGFGKSTAKLVEGEKTGVSFADVAAGHPGRHPDTRGLRQEFGPTVQTEEKAFHPVRQLNRAADSPQALCSRLRPMPRRGAMGPPPDFH